MRNTLVKTILDKYHQDQRTVLITGDLGFMAFEELREIMGPNFINAGVAEANMIGLAAGMSSLGYKPIVYSMIPFVTLHCLEQIRVMLCQTLRNVIIVGIGAGYSYGNQGPSHHATEDIAAMSALPGMTVIAPADPFEVEKALLAASGVKGPVYIRLAKNGERIIHCHQRSFDIGRFSLLRQGQDAIIFSTGEITGRCVNLADQLDKEGYKVAVHSCHTLKPFDCGTVVKAGRKSKLIFTAEQHVESGGLASKVALTLARNAINVKLFHSFCINDNYASVCGDKDYLEDIDGLSQDKMKEKIFNFLNEYIPKISTNRHAAIEA
jgi:transketolase